MATAVVLFRDAAADYVETYSKLHHRPKSRDKVLGVIKAFGEYLGAGADVRTITPRTIEAWRLARIEAGVARATVNSGLGTLKALLRWAKEFAGVLDSDPTKGLKMLRVPKRTLAQLLSEEQTLQLRAYQKAAGLTFLHDLTSLILNIGARRLEALWIRRSDVDLGRREIRVCNRGDGHEDAFETKTGHERLIPLNDVAHEVLARRILLGREYLFSAVRKDAPFNADNVTHDFKDAARAAGVPHATMHLLRHRWCTLMAQHVPPAVLMALAGHQSIETTLKFYVHRPQLVLPTPQNV